MPKPEDKGHGKPDKKPNKHGKGIEKFLSKGWNALHVSVGDLETEEIAFQDTQALVIPRGQIFDEDGDKLKGKERPRFNVVDTDTGAYAVFHDALKQAVTLIYRIVDVEEEPEQEPTPEAA